MVRVTLRLPDDLHRRLCARSEHRGESLNQVVVDALNDALARGEPAGRDGLPLDEQVRRVRAALGDLVIELDLDRFPPELRPGPDLPGRDALRARLPRLDPPMSRTIIEDREDRF